MAARLGFEPRQNESESFVLPLHHRAVKVLKDRGLFAGAGDGNRTCNRLFTKQVLCQLSYAGTGVPVGPDRHGQEAGTDREDSDWERTSCLWEGKRRGRSESQVERKMVAPQGLEP